jgi:DNA-binding response OmpR family regulator
MPFTFKLSHKAFILGIRRLLRRPAAIIGNILTNGKLALDPVNHVLKRDGVEIKLLPREFSLLE